MPRLTIEELEEYRISNRMHRDLLRQAAHQHQDLLRQAAHQHQPPAYARPQDAVINDDDDDDDDDQEVQGAQQRVAKEINPVFLALCFLATVVIYFAYEQVFRVRAAFSRLEHSIAEAGTAFERLEAALRFASNWNAIRALFIAILVGGIISWVLLFNGPFYSRFQDFPGPHCCHRFGWLSRACARAYPEAHEGCVVVFSMKVIIVVGLLVGTINKMRDLIDAVYYVYAEISNVMSAMSAVSVAANHLYWEAAATSTSVAGSVMLLLAFLGFLE